MRPRAAILLGALWLQAGAALAERIVTVDVSKTLGPLNRDLGGVTQGSANPNVNEALAAIGVPHIRVDAWFEQSGYDCATGTPDFSAVDQRVANVFAAGAEPLVIIDYMPACLSRYSGPSFGGQPDPTKQPPSDYDRWRSLVYAAVKHLAVDRGVRRFEAWNEPNLPQFFQGTLADYLDVFDSIETALRQVETETGLALELGGPATAFPDPIWMPAFLAHVTSQNSQLDFVSWHWYANYPLFGPIFTTPLGTIPPTNVENPMLRVEDYEDQPQMVRQWVETAWRLRQDGAAPPLLWLDEWNLNAGRDTRHDTQEDAAFAAAALDHMRRGGLDRASFFNVEDSTDPNFNQGMFFNTPADPSTPAHPKPVYSTFAKWAALESVRVPLSVGPLADTSGTGLEQFASQEDDVGGIAARSEDGKRLTVLLYNWSPRLQRAETVTLNVVRSDEVMATTTLTLDDSAVELLDISLP